MPRRAALPSLFALFLLAAPALGQVNLQWKFKDGETFYLEERIASKTTATVAGVKSTEEQTQVRVSFFGVKSRTKDGTVLEQRIESWTGRTVGGLPGVDDGFPLLEQLTRDVVFKVHLSPAGVVTKVEGFDQVIKKTAEIDKDEARKLQGLLTEDAWRSPLSMVFDVLPAKQVKKGESWKKENSASMGALGAVKFVTDFTYQGQVDGSERISSQGTFSYQPSKGGDGELGFRIVKMELTQKELTGKVVFDSVKGRLVEHQITLPMAGTMMIEVGGMQIEAQVEGTDSRILRISEKKPLPDV